MNLISNKSSDPKVLVLGSNRGNWHSSEKIQFAESTSGIESWAYAFNGSHYYSLSANKKLISMCDIIIANSNQGKNLKHLLKLAESRPANVKWVTLIEGSAEDYLKPMSFIRELFDSSDLINCINLGTLSFFRAMTSSKVEYIGIPYPVEYVARQSIPFESRKKEIFICPFLTTRCHDYFAASNLGLKMFGFEERLHRKITNLPKLLMKYGSINPNFKINKALDFYRDNNLSIFQSKTTENYYKFVGNAYFWLNLDNRWTWARYVLDAAALRIPIITTSSTSHAVELFPLTCLDDEFDIEKAEDLGRRLIQDFDFYKQVADVPLSKLEYLKAENMKKKLLDLL